MAKMRSLSSSSVLGVNGFYFWNERDLRRTLRATDAEGLWTSEHAG
jgi:hypothetical protein